MTKYIFIILFVSAFAQANEDSAYSEVARLRQYTGGSDESDLTVQQNLIQTAKSKKKKQSKPEPSEGF